MNFRMAKYDEPLLIEFSREGECGIERVDGVPYNIVREKPVDIPFLEENLLVRHFIHLSQMNYGVDTGLYPLGSCTMKYNPRICEEIAGWDCFRAVHPYQPESTIQGCLQIMYELEKMLCEITGMDAFTLQPSAGAHGEFTGLSLIKAYHEYNGESKRDEVILPDTAHGTNPASANMAGFKVIEIPSDDKGLVDLKMLKDTLSDRTACFMITNPNTLGLFESSILEVAKLVHNAGALLYYDGANMNAILGRARPGDMGFDVVHLNLHKTFSTPHGGGGPGAGPVGVKKHLEKFLPIPRIEKKNDTFVLNYNIKESIGKIRSFYGDFPVLLKAYIYISLLGKDGLRDVSDFAVLNANYLMHKLIKSGKYEVPYQGSKGFCKHEFVASCKKLLDEKEIRAMDVSKHLLDYGFHPPTVYFPLIVKEALMIEPTESASKDDLDGFADALLKIADEDVNVVRNAPTVTPVTRVDEVEANKNLVLTWRDIK